MPTIATIFLAYKANECNKSLTAFLLREKKSFKGSIDLTVFLVKNVEKLDKKITKLPTMEWAVNGKKQFIVGNSAIIETIEKATRKAPVDKDSVDAFWNDIMLSGGDDVSPEDEFTRSIPSLVENISQKRSSKRNDDDTPEAPQQETKGSISSFEDDPVMKRFYENMETSPGESQYESNSHEIS